MPDPNFIPGADAFALEESLPDTLPEDPWGIFRRWFDEAHTRKVTPNPNAMTIATVDEQGHPSARTVLCKSMDLAPTAGYLTFFTNYQGRKGRELAATPRAALLFHWDTMERQVRVEGPVVKSPDTESDTYFQSRAIDRRIGAWASDQSQPIDSRDALLEKVAEVMARFDVGFDSLDSAVIPRPPHWGGFRVWAETVELWMGGPGRVHDRAIWQRTLTPADGAFKPSAWTSTRLQP